MNLIEHWRFCDSFPPAQCVISARPCVICYALQPYESEYICMKAKDILAFKVIVESSQLFGPFPQTVGDRRFPKNFGPFCSSSCVTMGTPQSLLKVQA